MYRFDLDDIINFLHKFIHLYDVVRVVDPIKKQVVHFEEKKQLEKSFCYDYWKKGFFCENCTSLRAFNENDTIVKIEYNFDKIYMIISSPVLIKEEKYVVELLKELPETGVIPDINGKTIDEINSIIAKLNHEVVCDPLTQSFNRRYIDERLPLDIMEAVKTKTALSVMLLDIDHFKQINDNYGHQAGDYILKEIVNIVSSMTRHGVDWIARYGGEEFLISMFGADNFTANGLSHEMLRIIENYEFIYDGERIPVTASIGCHTMHGEAITVTELISLVDKNLYSAKKDGRNTVVSE